MTLDPRGLWPGFLGSVFVLMGLSLALDAEAHADSALEWQGQDEAARSSLLWAYRGFGSAFVAAGAWLLAGWALYRGALIEKLGAAVAGPASSRAGGLFIAACGLGLAALRAHELARPRRHRFIEAELADPGLPLRRKLATASGWLLVLVLLAFGTFLILMSRR